jgi:O-acetylserine/cysteine efflux transporter
LQPRHIALAVVLSIFWGLNFVVIAIALGDFPPIFLAAARFAIAALPALFLPKPPIPWPRLIAISACLFIGQFGLLFPAMTVGMPAGLASIAVQIQAFITIGIAAAVIGERPTGRQLAGAAVAFAGLALIATTVGANGVTLAGLLLLLGAAASWATGNVLLRSARAVDMLALVSWCSVAATLPLLALSVALEGPDRIGAAVIHASWQMVLALLYIALVSTTFGYGVWGQLMKRYPAATVAPFALLVPVSGTISAALILGERFGPARLAGMVLILAGLSVLALGRRPPAVDPA